MTLRDNVKYGIEDNQKENTLSYDEALSLIGTRLDFKETLILNRDLILRLTDWQFIKKACYDVCFGMKPEDSGDMQSDLQRLNDISIVKYLIEGGRLPTEAHINAIRIALKEFCEDSTNSRNIKSTHYWEPSITISN